MDSLDQIPELKGSFQKKFYHPDIIFWIVMGCGEARFGRAKKHLKLKILVSKFFPGIWRRPAHKGSLRVRKVKFF